MALGQRTPDESDSKLQTSPPQGNMRIITCTCLIVQSIVGGGLLAFPYTCRQRGIVNTMILQAVLLPFIAMSLWILGLCAERTGAKSYQELVRRSLGRRYEVFSVVAIFAGSFGASVVYLDIFADQVHPWLEDAKRFCDEGSSWACVLASLQLHHRPWFIIVTSVLFSFLTLGSSLSSLSVPALLGTGALLYTCLVIVCNYFVGSSARSGEIMDVNWWQPGFGNSLMVMPVICFSYQGHVGAVPLYMELADRSVRRWLSAIAIGLTLCATLYSSDAVLGYLSFGEAAEGDILQSFVSHPELVFVPSGFVVAARVAVASAVSVTSSIFTHCARSATLSEMQRCGVSSGILDSRLCFLGITYVWIGSVTAVAIVFPDISSVVSMSGNFFAFLIFIFPGLFLIHLDEAKEDVEDLGVSLQQKGTGSSQSSPGTSVVLLEEVASCVCAEQTWAAVRRRCLGISFVLLGVFVFAVGMIAALFDF